MFDSIKSNMPNWRHYFGNLAFLMLIVQLVTGLVLAFFYEPALNGAYKSVQYMANEVTGGGLARNIHRWIAFSVLAATLVHAIRSTLRGDFLNPAKRVNWLAGVGLVLPVFLFIYTGLILPWEWKGYWFMEMIASYASTLPVIGPGMKGFFLETFTLPRYLVIHILILPVIALILVDYHFLSALRQRGIFRHILRHASMALPFIIMLILLSVYITIPSKDPDEIPMPLDGAYIPAPEWYGLTVLLPFRYFKGNVVPFLSIYLPLLVFLLFAFLPYLLKKRAKDPSTLQARPYSLGGKILRGMAVFVVFIVFYCLIYLGSYESPTFGCTSCHNLSRGFRMGIPPDTFRDRNTLPNLDDDKWMMGHWYYPTEIY